MNNFTREHAYNILGVSAQSTPAQIRRAYLILAKKCHHDKNPSPSSTAQFQRVSAAYQKLIEPPEAVTSSALDDLCSACDIFNHAKSCRFPVFPDANWSCSRLSPEILDRQMSPSPELTTQTFQSFAAPSSSSMKPVSSFLLECYSMEDSTSPSSSF